MRARALPCVMAGLCLVQLSCIREDNPTSSETSRSEETFAVTPESRHIDVLLPSPWTDPAGDVSLSNADMIAGTIVVGEGTVELRAQFADPPFPSVATHFINWCIDLDENSSTGSMCGSGQLIGADAVVGFENVPERHMQLYLLRQDLPQVVLDPAAHAIVDAATNTVRVCFPHGLLLDDSRFDYAVGSTFGGSFGANDWAPNVPGFGPPSSSFVNEVGTPTPCCPTLVEACVQVGARADAECPCAGPWRNHGAYVSCVARLVARAVTDWSDCFTAEERAEISFCVVNARARSQCGKSSRILTPKLGMPAAVRIRPSPREFE